MIGLFFLVKLEITTKGIFEAKNQSFFFFCLININDFVLRKIFLKIDFLKFEKNIYIFLIIFSYYISDYYSIKRIVKIEN